MQASLAATDCLEHEVESWQASCTIKMEMGQFEKTRPTFLERNSTRLDQLTNRSDKKKNLSGLRMMRHAK